MSSVMSLEDVFRWTRLKGSMLRVRSFTGVVRWLGEASPAISDGQASAGHEQDDFCAMHNACRGCCLRDTFCDHFPRAHSLNRHFVEKRWSTVAEFKTEMTTACDALLSGALFKEK